MAFTRDILGHYAIQGPQTEATILAAAEDILHRRLQRQGNIDSPENATRFLQMRLGHLAHEEFHAIWLDNHHQILEVDRLFRGSVASSEVHPREVIRRALQVNAAAVIFAHNHPSGITEPSGSDKVITTRLKETLALIDVRVLDHIIVGAGAATSMAARGLV